MKDTFYFQHDNNARNDPRLLEVRAEMGNLGYAIYFLLLEMMAESEDGKINIANVSALAFGLNENPGNVKHVISIMLRNGGFIQEGDYIYSQRMIDYKEWRNDLREKRKIAGKNGRKKQLQGKSPDNNGQLPSDVRAIAQQVPDNSWANDGHRIGQDRIGQDRIGQDSDSDRIYKNIEDRESEFRVKVFSLGSDYPEKMIEAFIDYWTQCPPKGRKMKFEKEKTFDISKRLSTWARKGNVNKLRSDHDLFVQVWEAQFDMEMPTEATETGAIAIIAQAMERLAPNHEPARAFEYMLSCWPQLSKFYADQIKPSQIAKNIPNIYQQIKSSKQSMPKSRI